MVLVLGWCLFALLLLLLGFGFVLGWCGFEKGRPDQCWSRKPYKEERASERAGVEQCQLRKGVRLTAGAGAQRPLSAF